IREVHECFSVVADVAQHAFSCNTFLVDDKNSLKLKGVSDGEFLIREQGSTKRRTDLLSPKVHKQVRIAVLDFSDNARVDFQNCLDIDCEIGFEAHTI